MSAKRQSASNVGRVREIFCELRRIEHTIERQQVLAERTGDDKELRRQVEQLLSAAQLVVSNPLERVGNIIGPTEVLEASSLPPDATTNITLNSTIGPYKLMEQIGEGGMGVVYVALQQKPIRRTVALKVVKPGMSSKQVLARFEAERQALALMNHPNIAKVLDAGSTDSGAPFFVMELVKGIPITEYCEKHKLSLHERLELLVTVCDAVQHAHHKGIIHRDIKPSNLLVELEDVRAVPKVIDFGVAKAMQQPLTEQTIYTGIAQMIGTPLYMSPEQAELNGLDVDTRSDVYSLGVVLYELITGCTPFDRDTLKRASFDEMRRIIREDEPIRPSSRISTLENRQQSTLVERDKGDWRRINASIQSELDWIVMRALEKDRARRYPTASAMGEDIKRFLAGEAVEACPPSVLYKMSKTIRRNRGLVFATALIGTAIVAGGAISMWQALRASEAQRKTLVRSQLAREAVDEMYTEVAQDWLSQKQELNDLQRRFLEKAQRYYEIFSDDNDGAIVDALRAKHRVAKMKLALGDLDAAIQEFNQLVARCQSNASSGPTQSVLVAARAWGADIHRAKGDDVSARSEAESAYRELVSLNDANLDVVSRRELADACNALARVLTLLGYESEATVAADKCVSLQLALVSEQPTSFDQRFALALAYSRQGMQRLWWGTKNSESEDAYLRAQNLLNELLLERPSHRQCRASLQHCLGNLAILAMRQGKKEAELSFLEQSVQLSEQLCREFPNDRDSLVSLAIGYGNLASATVGDEKLEALRKCCEVRETLAKQFPQVDEYLPQYMDLASAYSLALSSVNRREEMGHVLKHTIEMLEAHSGKHGIKREALNTIAMICSLLCIRAEYLLEGGDFRAAGITLEKLGLTPTSLETGLDLSKNNVGEHWEQERLDRLANRSLLARWCALLLRECERLAKSDLSIKEDVRNQESAAYAEKAERFLSISLALQTQWKDLYCKSPNVRRNGLRSIVHDCEEWSIQMNEKGMRFSQSANHDHYLSSIRCVLQHATSTEIDLTPVDAMAIVGFLTTGPMELRDPSLALTVGERAVVLDPDLSYLIGWSAYRLGDYARCLESIPPNLSLSGAVRAMALWQQGQHEAARESLGAAYQQRIKEYLTSCDVKESQGRTSYPTAKVIREWDREARELIGIESD